MQELLDAIYKYDFCKIKEMPDIKEKLNKPYNKHGWTPFMLIVKEFYEGIVEHFNELKSVVEKNIKGYTLDRLFKVDLAILIMATYELMYYKQNSVKIVANEAVELAKKYSTEKSYSFINAVVASIAEKL